MRCHLGLLLVRFAGFSRRFIVKQLSLAPNGAFDLQNLAIENLPIIEGDRHGPELA